MKEGNTERGIPAEMVAEAMRKVYEGGLTTPSGGNISMRDVEGNVWVSPTLLDKGTLRGEDVVCIGRDGSISGRQKPTSEYPFHLAIYASRPEVNAVVHNHSPALVACSLTSVIPDLRLLPILTDGIGEVVKAPYAIPGSDDLASVVASAFATGAGAVLMANHGIITVGADLQEALLRMVRLELLAQSVVTASRVVGFDSLVVPSSSDVQDAFQPSAENPVAASSEVHVAFHPLAETPLAPSSDLLKYRDRAICRKLNPQGLGSWSERYGNGRFSIFGQDVRIPAEWEYELHREIYNTHSHIQCVALAYPPALMAYSLLSQEFSARTIPESYIFLREAMTLDLKSFLADPQSLVKALSPSSPVALVQNGFFLATGDSPYQVLDRLEVAENTAASLLSASALGAVRPMDEAVIKALKEKYLS